MPTSAEPLGPGDERVEARAGRPGSRAGWPGSRRCPCPCHGALQIGEDRFAFGRERPLRRRRSAPERRRAVQAVGRAGEDVAGHLAHVEGLLVLFERRPFGRRERRYARRPCIPGSAPTETMTAWYLASGVPLGKRARERRGRDRRVPRRGDDRFERDPLALQRGLPGDEVGLGARGSEQQHLHVDALRRPRERGSD